MAWTLEHGGIEQTFEQWGLRGLKRTQPSLAAGTVTFVHNAAYDATPLFAVDDEIIIRRDGQVWHVGPVLSVPCGATVKNEAQAYTVGDPFWYLDNLAYSQEIALANEEGLIAQRDTTQVLMFAVVEGGGVWSKINVQAMIAQAIALAVAAGAKMQVSFTGDFTVVPPTFQLKDPTCAEVIRTALRLVPDTAGGWDYSTTDVEGNPLPTLRLCRRGSATARTLDVADKQTLSELTLTPRDDLRKDRVVIYYEYTNTDGGEVSITHAVRAAGTGSPFRTLKVTVPLSGYNRQFQEQYLETEAVSPNSSSWWKDNVAQLQNATSLEISDGGIAPASGSGPTFNRRIVRGSIPGWMEASTVSGRMRVTAVGSYTLSNSDGAESQFKDDELSTDVFCTSLGTDTYRNETSYSGAESVPEGVENTLLAALSVTHWDGSCTVHKRECEFVARPGDVLNLSNGRSAWTTMRAQIQQVTENVDAGQTELKFGPPHQLSVQDLVELCKTFRLGPAVAVQDAASGSKSTDRLQGNAGGANDAGGPLGAHWHKVVAKGPDGGTLTLDADEGIRMDKGSKEIALEMETPRMTINDGSGNVIEIKGDKITMEGPGTASLELSPDGITLYKDGRSCTLSFESIVFVGAAAVSRMESERILIELGDNSVLINDEQMVVNAGSGMGTYGADEMSVSDGGDEVFLQAAAGVFHNASAGSAEISAGGGFSHSNGGNAASLSAGVGMEQSSGANVVGVSASTGLGHTLGSKTAECSANRVRLVNGSDNVSITTENGLDNTSSGQRARISGPLGVKLEASSGTTLLQAIAAKDISLRLSSACLEGTSKDVYILRDEPA